MHKRYWIQNIRTNEELILDAENLNEVVIKTGWDRKFIRINKVYYRKGTKSNLILNY